MFFVYADDEVLFDPTDMTGRRTIFNALLALEMGKAGSFEFSLPVTNDLYDGLKKLKTTISVYMDDEELFRGRIVSEERDFDNLKKFSCEGDLTYLSDTVQQTFAYEGTVHELFGLFIELHNERAEEQKQFVPGTITVENKPITVSGVDEDTTSKDFDYNQLYINYNSIDWNTTIDQITTYILDTCGGYLRVRHEDGVNYLDLLKDNYGHTTSQPLEFGVNITDLKAEISMEDLFTVLIPIGDNNLTIESVNDGSDELCNEELVEKYGRIIKTNVFDANSKPEMLMENAQHYMDIHCREPYEITINAVDMNMVDEYVMPIRLGDVVRVRSTPHGIDDDFVCSKITYDLKDPSGNEYVFGQPKPTFTEKYRREPNKSGGGGAGKAKEEEDAKKFGDFYDAYINLSPESGNATLGAIYKKALQLEEVQSKVKYILTSELGLSMDAPNGQYRLSNIKSLVDYTANQVSNYAADIYLLTGRQEDHEARIQLNTAASENNKKLYESQSARIDILSNDTASRIELMLQQGKKTEQGLELLQTNIDGVRNTQTIINTDIVKIKSQLTEVVNLVAKRITAEELEGDYAKLGNLTSKSLTTGGLTVNNLHVTGTYVGASDAVFTAKRFNVSDAISVGGEEVATQKWCTDTFSRIDWDNISGRPNMLKKMATGSDGKLIYYWGWK